MVLDGRAICSAPNETVAKCHAAGILAVCRDRVEKLAVPVEKPCFLAIAVVALFLNLEPSDVIDGNRIGPLRRRQE